MAAGETEILEVVAPEFQLYVVAPLAFNIAEFPEQIVALLTAITGVAFTVTVPTFAFVQPLDEPVTV